MLKKKPKQRAAILSNSSILLNLLLSAKQHEELMTILKEICTPDEILQMVERVTIVKELMEERSYREIGNKYGASSYIIARAKRAILNARTQHVTTRLSRMKRV